MNFNGIVTYQRVINDPGGDEPVRMINYTDTDLVDGSILNVRPDTEAYFVCNGEISSRYTHGRYEIRTGVNPFFVRFRNLMTAGNPGISCQVWFVNTKKENIHTGGTGDMVFNEERFNVSMRARGSYSMRYVIVNPLALISQLVGMHIGSAAQIDIRTALETIILPIIKQEIINYLSNNSIYAFQSNLSQIGQEIKENVRTELGFYGIYPASTVITSVNIDQDDLKRLNELEGQYAKGRINTDIEVDNINRVYGNLERRTLTEVATGSVRGSATSVRNHGADTVGLAGMVAALPVHMAVANKVMSSLSGPLSDMMDGAASGRSDCRNSGTTSAPERTERRSGGNAGKIPPDLPPQRIECSNCHKRVDINDDFCKFCGHKIR